MTKEEAIDLLDNLIGMISDNQDSDYDEALKLGIKALSENKGEWIPVSERLPETDDDVLVTDGVDMFVAWYSRKDMWQGWMSSDNNFEINTPIEAWQPLPEPYKVVSE